MVLWLTAMSCYHTTERKPELFTLEKEQKFLATDSHFQGAMISALDKKYINSYIICTTTKNL